MLLFNDMIISIVGIIIIIITYGISYHNLSSAIVRVAYTGHNPRMYYNIYSLVILKKTLSSLMNCRVGVTL